jgi:hypothetical protein
MYRPGRGAPLPPWITPEMLAQLFAVIMSGVTDVKYADREIKYADIGDLLKAWDWGTRVAGGGGRQRSVACFSKGLPPTSPGLSCGPEHAEGPVTVPFDDDRDAPPVPPITRVG